MRAIIDAIEFKRLVNGTKRFTGITSNKASEYIYLEIDAENKIIKASACEGHEISIEYAKVKEVDVSFKCFIKPNIPKICNSDRNVEIELVDKKAYITVNENITGYKQPEQEFFKIDKLVKDTLENEITASICVDARLLKNALASIKTGWDKSCDIEIRGKDKPIIIRTGEDNIKLVLPMRR